MHFFHKWSMWSRPTEDSSQTAKKRQWRYCLKCGKVQSRLMRDDDSTTQEQINIALDSVSENALARIRAKIDGVSEQSKGLPPKSQQ